MTVLFRWFFLSTLARIAAITFAMILIFMIAESIDKSRYLGDGLDMILLAEYMVLKVPLIISKLMPIIVLIAVAIYLMEVSNHHELVALRAAGITFVRILSPLLAAGFLVGLLMFAVGEWVEPLVNERLNYIDRVHIEKAPDIEAGEQWLQDNQTLMRLTPLTQNYFTISMIKRNEQGAWQERIDANLAHYEQGSWRLEHVYISQPTGFNDFSLEHLDHLNVPSTLSPRVAKTPNPRDMHWLELYHFEQALSEAGLESKTYMFHLQRKLAAPISCIIMVILAFSLCGNMGERFGQKSKGLLFAIALGLGFYAVSAAIEVITTGNQLPVVYAAWFPNILFFGMSGYLLLKKEGY